MIEWNYDYDAYFIYFINGAALVLSFFGLWQTAIMPGIERWSKRFFRVLFTVLVVLSALGFIETFTYDHRVPNWVLHTILVIETLVLTIPMPMMTAYLIHCCGEKLFSNKLFHVVLSLWSFFALIVMTAPFTGFFYNYTPDGKFYREAWYPFALLPMAAAMLLTLVGMVRWRGRLSRKAFMSFILTLFPMTGAVIVQMFTEIYPLLDICIVISALSMYSLILSDQIEQDLKRQREIANQRTSIMVLQMRPHFIYNTMTSIYCLCEQDPKLARQVIMDFTTYLRKNFTAIASETPIPFTSELEHTRAYLAVEQAQYEDGLFVDYDIPHTLFRLPPLTLQPIVENSIKHGRDPYAGPFRICIRTRKTDLGSEIVVFDNGRGFDTAKNSEPNTALKNIQERLEIMCGGSLTVTSNDGGGTVVTVTIPD